MISAGDPDQSDARPRAGARLSAMRVRLALTERRRVRRALWLVFGLVLCWPVVSAWRHRVVIEWRVAVPIALSPSALVTTGLPNCG